MRRTALLLAALVLAAAGCGGDGDEAGPDGPGVQERDEQADPRETIELRLSSFALEPATIELDEPGSYVFRVINDGDHRHALAISGPNVEAATPTMQPGETSDLPVELDEGRYELWCPVPTHREQGMEGALTVGDAEGEAGDDGEEGEEGEEQAPLYP